MLYCERVLALMNWLGDGGKNLPAAGSTVCSSRGKN